MADSADVKVFGVPSAEIRLSVWSSKGMVSMEAQATRSHWRPNHITRNVCRTQRTAFGSVWSERIRR